MTPISAIASLPTTGPDLEPGAGRAARRATPTPDAAAPNVSLGDDAAPERGFWDRLWGKEGFSFGAMLDIINPLQHIPIVSTIYRAATGDTIGPGPRMLGGAIFGGVVGLFASAADAAVEGLTGKDTGSHVLAMLPEPDPVAQLAYGDEPHRRGLMTTVLNLPSESPVQFVATAAMDQPATDKTALEAADAVAEPVTTEVVAAPATAIRVSDPAPDQKSGRLFTPPPRTAQLGAGGRLVPLSTNGRPGSSLPTPQELAANPALLQEMRQGGASAVNTTQKNTGRIDTAIKGRGLVAPSPAAEARQNHPAGAAAWLDRMAREPQAISRDAEPKENLTAEQRAAAPREAPAIPEVGPDFLMKMQQALDKYQAMRPAPTIDVSH